MGQHLPCQYQGRHHRNLPAYPAPARRPLSSAYEYRFNRRFNLPNMVPALAKAAVATAPKPYATLRTAETFG
jgi:hypothetical protein